ncbi:hypothetical protein EJC47_11075 [Sphingomonas sp. TF3]|uniref:hypothetical protein n=1 Tax=Sphingomonas sp. TF3 TaxID=2495580 RepID=UPI000F8675CE|nr:hypothetical protein [Sphingomonas sp. TF3]RUN76505.1 hypothetical protein EJC47_11075 [Sphingomonas sp. TF3]
MIDEPIPKDVPWPPVLTPDQNRARVKAERRFNEERLRLFRTYAGLILRRVSPILIDFAELRGIDMQDRMRRMRPAGGWSDKWRMRTSRPGVGAKARRPSTDAVKGLWGRVPSSSLDDPDLRLGITMERDSLQPEFHLGDAACYGAHGVIELWVRGSIPDTLAVGAVGRPLATVVHHDLFERREYPIRSVIPNVVDWSIITADAPAEPIPAAWLAGI